jgi:hypothetical protein
VSAPPLGDQPKEIDEELWDLLNQSTERPLAMGEARLVAREITALRGVAGRALDRYLSEVRLHEELGFALNRSAEENERLRTWITFAAPILDTSRFGNPDANSAAAAAPIAALNPDRPAPGWERPTDDHVELIEEPES